MLIIEFERTFPGVRPPNLPSDQNCPAQRGKTAFRSTTGRVEIRRKDLTVLVSEDELAKLPETTLGLAFWCGQVRLAVERGETCAAFAEMSVDGCWQRLTIPISGNTEECIVLSASGMLEVNGLRFGFAIHYE